MAAVGEGSVMSEQKVRGIAYDDDWWPDPTPMSGSAHYVSSDRSDPRPILLVPDGQGDYREYLVMKQTKGKMGF